MRLASHAVAASNRPGSGDPSDTASRVPVGPASPPPKPPSLPANLTSGRDSSTCSPCACPQLVGREDALAAIEEAVTLYRGLTAQRPDAFTPNLATALNNLSTRLSELGRHDEALTAVNEAAVTVLPMLERVPWCLPDAGQRLVQRFVACCQACGRAPDNELLSRYDKVLEIAGAISADPSA